MDFPERAHGMNEANDENDEYEENDGDEDSDDVYHAMMIRRLTRLAALNLRLVSRGLEAERRTRRQPHPRTAARRRPRTN